MNHHKLSLPFEWALDNLLRPVLILVCGMLLFNLPILIYKIKLLLKGILYLLFCNDKTWKRPQDPASIFEPILRSGVKIDRKTVYFVRHGESTWNDTFNKGNHRSLIVFVIGFFPGLAKALMYELYLILSGKLDSWFFDSPISGLGLEQVDALAAFLKETPTDNIEGKHLGILRADPGAPPSKLLCSNLRRAVSTVAAGFRDRLSRRYVVDPIATLYTNSMQSLVLIPFFPICIKQTPRKDFDRPFIARNKVNFMDITFRPC